jgi:hypothetical protein
MRRSFPAGVSPPALPGLVIREGTPRSHLQTRSTTSGHTSGQGQDRQCSGASSGGRQAGPGLAATRGNRRRIGQAAPRRSRREVGAMEVESHTALPLMPRSSPFPEEWGTPPAGVDERRGWMIRNIRAGEVRARRGERVPWLPAKASCPLSAGRRYVASTCGCATRTGSGRSRSSSSRRAHDDALSAHARGPRRRSPGGLSAVRLPLAGAVQEPTQVSALLVAEYHSGHPPEHRRRRRHLVGRRIRRVQALEAALPLARRLNPQDPGKGNSLGAGMSLIRRGGRRDPLLCRWCSGA